MSGHCSTCKKVTAYGPHTDACPKRTHPVKPGEWVVLDQEKPND